VNGGDGRWPRSSEVVEDEVTNFDDLTNDVNEQAKYVEMSPASSRKRKPFELSEREIAWKLKRDEACSRTV